MLLVTTSQVIISFPLAADQTRYFIYKLYWHLYYNLYGIALSISPKSLPSAPPSFNGMSSKSNHSSCLMICIADQLQVVVKDFVSRAVVAQFSAHNSLISSGYCINSW